MCYSLTASLSASAILIPIGLYTIIRAAKYNHRYLLLASVPLFFGIQQFCEGLVWYGFGGHFAMIHNASLGFLFFAYFFWPAFIPLSVYMVEENIRKQWILALLAIVGLALGAKLYVPLLLDATNLKTTIFHHSINYLTYQNESMVTFYIFTYVAILVFSFSVSSIKAIQYLGLMILMSFFVSIYWYLVTFTSVWCFFAALISAYVVYIIHKAAVKK